MNSKNWFCKLNFTLISVVITTEFIKIIDKLEKIAKKSFTFSADCPQRDIFIKNKGTFEENKEKIFS